VGRAEYYLSDRSNAGIDVIDSDAAPISAGTILIAAIRTHPGVNPSIRVSSARCPARTQRPLNLRTQGARMLPEFVLQTGDALGN
jgi:hypothetical protein